MTESEQALTDYYEGMASRGFVLDPDTVARLRQEIVKESSQ